ncbi:mitochondrial import inner membrane translocase subunit tim21 [Rhizina undulata]
MPTSRSIRTSASTLCSLRSNLSTTALKCNVVRTPRRMFTCSPTTAADAKQEAPRKQTMVATHDVSSRKWADLSGRQRVVRTASTGTSIVVILGGLALTGAVFTLLYLEVFAPDSATNWFNRVHERIKKDPECIRLLGEGKRIKAFGEPTNNRWSRNRPLAHSVRKDRSGAEHLLMHFNVKGEYDSGVVYVHLVRRPGHSDYEYKYLYLDVPGKHRLYLENADTDPEKGGNGWTRTTWQSFSGGSIEIEKGEKSQQIYILTTTSSLYRSLDLSNLRSTSFHDCKLPPKLHSYLQLASSVTITSPTELSIYHVLHILHAASTSERLQHVSLTALSSARCYTPSFISFFHHCGGGLKHVNLSFMSVISSTVLALFASNPCLETLILGFTDIDESVLPAFSSARKLSELDISGCFYLDKRLLRAFLRSGLPPALRKLGMRNMVDLKIGWVYDLLMEPCPGDLEVVDLGCCGVRRGDLEVVRGLWKGVKVMGEGLEGGETRWGIKRSRDVVRRRM